jgi:hypothetical protein
MGYPEILRKTPDKYGVSGGWKEHTSEDFPKLHFLKIYFRLNKKLNIGLFIRRHFLCLMSDTILKTLPKNGIVGYERNFPYRHKAHR